MTKQELKIEANRNSYLALEPRQALSFQEARGLQPLSIHER